MAFWPKYPRFLERIGVITKQIRRAAIGALVVALASCSSNGGSTPAVQETAARPNAVSTTPTVQPLVELTKLPVDTATKPAPPHRPVWKVGYDVKAYTQATLEFLRAAAINAKLTPGNAVVQYTIYDGQQAFDCGNGVIQPPRVSPVLYCPAIQRVLVIPQAMQDSTFWTRNKMAPSEAFYYLLNAFAQYLLGTQDYDDEKLVGCRAGLLARESVVLDPSHFRETGSKLLTFYMGSVSEGRAIQAYVTGDCDSGK